MLSRKTRPATAKILTGGQKPAGVYDAITSPRTPLDFIKIQSPRNIKSYGAAGVGLGIVAALEKSNDNKTLCDSFRSSPIPVKNSGKNNCNNNNNNMNNNISGEFEGESYGEEDYTYVTCHVPNKKSQTRVYYNGVDRKTVKSKAKCVFDISPAVCSSVPAASFPEGDFLSSCHLCQKKLHGEDIYMYRGEKAFCSTECRYKQIVMDERKEKYCSSEASRSVVDTSNSPYTSSSNAQRIYTTGIFAI